MPDFTPEDSDPIETPWGLFPAGTVETLAYISLPETDEAAVDCKFDPAVKSGGAASAATVMADVQAALMGMFPDFKGFNEDEAKRIAGLLPKGVIIEPCWISVDSRAVKIGGKTIYEYKYEPSDCFNDALDTVGSGISALAATIPAEPTEEDAKRLLDRWAAAWIESRKPAPAPEPSNAPMGLLTIAPIDHRCGRWNEGV